VPPSRREKRLALQQAKAKEREEGHEAEVAKLLSKQPKQTTTPKLKKAPKEYRRGEPRYPHRMLYTTDLEDREGAWSWGVVRDWHPDPGNDYIYNFLNGYRVKTWREIHEETVTKGRHNVTARNISYPIDRIRDEAQQRLVVLQLDDQDEIFRFRMSGRRRLFGFIFDTTFKTVWHDPNHAIYDD